MSEHVWALSELGLEAISQNLITVSGDNREIMFGGYGYKFFQYFPRSEKKSLVQILCSIRSWKTRFLLKMILSLHVMKQERGRLEETLQKHENASAEAIKFDQTTNFSFS